MNNHYITGQLSISDHVIDIVSGELVFADILGALRVRWSIRRHDYKVEPGLYAIGKPDAESRVFVTANYKLSFDHLRKNLHGINAWILVLNTRGINVWCAAGKGTFGTKEIIFKIKTSHLEEIVNHRNLILPQLGAAGVAPSEVFNKTGFHVIYGPVRASDIKSYLDAGLATSPEMRKVVFPFWERLKLTPVEIMGNLKYLVMTIAALFVLSGINHRGYSVDKAFVSGSRAAVSVLAAYSGGTFLVPVLLPWIPFRSFSWKGIMLGFIISLLAFYTWNHAAGSLEKISWFFLIPAITSYLAMNFTGSSTFTSLSGVLREMKRAVPIQAGMAILGILFWLMSRIF